MKFTVTFKCPDAVDDALRDIGVDEEGEEGGNTEQEARALAEKFIKWGEYATIEFDTDKGTATVKPA